MAVEQSKSRPIRTNTVLVQKFGLGLYIVLGRLLKAEVVVRI